MPSPGRPSPHGIARRRRKRLGQRWKRERCYPSTPTRPAPRPAPTARETPTALSSRRPPSRWKAFRRCSPAGVPVSTSAMLDNGFGSKDNSQDFLIRAYYIEPDFKTVSGGAGTVAVKDFIAFCDPNRKIGFPIVNEQTSARCLTGGDIDPESMQRAPNGDYWVGDEFGPWILHFDRAGVLLDAPHSVPGHLLAAKIPGVLMSPDNPFKGTAAHTLDRSRGFEAMALTPDGTRLIASLEGATRRRQKVAPGHSRIQHRRSRLHGPDMVVPHRGERPRRRGSWRAGRLPVRRDRARRAGQERDVPKRLRDRSTSDGRRRLSCQEPGGRPHRSSRPGLHLAAADPSWRRRHRESVPRGVRVDRGCSGAGW